VARDPAIGKRGDVTHEVEEHSVDRSILVRKVLEANDELRGSAVACTFEDGSQWTFAEALDAAYRSANFLRAAGVGQDDRVVVMLPNGKEFLSAWWGIATLGAQMVALNVAWKGEMLSHALALSQPIAIVTSTEFTPLLSEVAGTTQVVLAERLTDGGSEPPELSRQLEPWDIHHVQFTSGTTGPSKASVSSYQQFFMTGSWAGEGVGMTPDDTVLCDLPLFHSGSLAIAFTCMVHGGQLAIRTAPSMTHYWEVAKETGATFGFLVSSMVDFLLLQPQSSADRNHHIRAMLSAPLPPNVEDFQSRFGVDEVITAFGSSETAAPIVRVPGTPSITGSSGRVRPPYVIRAVDEFDRQVPVNSPGELIVRSDEPWCISTDYFRDPTATAEAWRNGWFHTGDQVRIDEDGNVFFVDRIKDALRRRGENISTFEVERAVLTHPLVMDAGCVGVKIQGLSDDEVKVWIVCEPDLDELDLVRFLESRLPHYMVPRFLERIDALPVTASRRVKKYELRAMGNGASTWDLQEHGYRITRTGLIPIGDP
jgi:carnitine-CoA ligase